VLGPLLDCSRDSVLSLSLDREQLAYCWSEWVLAFQAIDRAPSFPNSFDEARLYERS
jgi:hypothetical protein